MAETAEIVRLEKKLLKAKINEVNNLAIKGYPQIKVLTAMVSQMERVNIRV